MKQEFLENCLKIEMEKALRLEAENERLQFELMTLRQPSFETDSQMRPRQGYETDSQIVKLSASSKSSLFQASYAMESFTSVAPDMPSPIQKERRGPPEPLPRNIGKTKSQRKNLKRKLAKQGRFSDCYLQACQGNRFLKKESG